MNSNKLNMMAQLSSKLTKIAAGFMKLKAHCKIINFVDNDLEEMCIMFVFSKHGHIWEYWFHSEYTQETNDKTMNELLKKLEKWINSIQY